MPVTIPHFVIFLRGLDLGTQRIDTATTFDPKPLTLNGLIIFFQLTRDLDSANDDYVVVRVPSQRSLSRSV